jgi:hypothetical protein
MFLFLKVILSIYILYKIRERVNAAEQWQTYSAFWSGIGAVVPSIVALLCIWLWGPYIFEKFTL